MRFCSQTRPLPGVHSGKMGRISSQGCAVIVVGFPDGAKLLIGLLGGASRKGYLVSGSLWQGSVVVPGSCWGSMVEQSQ